MLKFLQMLGKLDRRWVFTLVFLAVIIPLLYPLNFPISVSDPVKKFYGKVESLPPGSVVLVSFDYRAASYPECHPMALAFVEHCFKKNIKVVALTLLPDAAPFISMAFDTYASKYKKKYGIDYVNLGYKSGLSVVVQKMGSNIKAAFPRDYKNTDLDELPLTKDIKNFKDFVAIADFADCGIFDKCYILIASAQYGVPVIGGCTAVTAPEYYCYLNSGQLTGLLGGMQGAAEYEKLLNHKGRATAGMDAQSILHALLVVLIIFANISYFLSIRRKKNEQEAVE